MNESVTSRCVVDLTLPADPLGLAFGAMDVFVRCQPLTDSVGLRGPCIRNLPPDVQKDGLLRPSWFREQHFPCDHVVMNKGLIWLYVVFFVVYFILISVCGGLAMLWSTNYQWWVFALMAIGAALLTAVSFLALDGKKKTLKKK